MRRLVLFTVLFAATAWGCKTKVETKPDPETEEKLSDCEESLESKKDYIKTLEERLAELESGEGGEVVVELEGPLEDGAILNVTAGGGPHARGGGGGGGAAKGNADDTKLYEEFVGQLRRSRPSIKKCYQNALKKDTRLQARPVTVNIQVDYRTNGKVSDASFNPRISQHFYQCMKNVADRWKLPAMPRAVSFNYRQRLTPE